MTNYDQKREEITKHLESDPPAFPVTFKLDEESLLYAGMTLRDYFAAQALAGIAARCTVDGYSHHIAKIAYSVADAMMKAREENK